MHFGESAFSTNILSSMFANKPENIQTFLYKDILKTPYATVNAGFYSALLSKPLNIINLFFMQVMITGVQMLSAILQIWISIMIYLIFFGRKLNVPAKFRLLMLITIPYFILLPVSMSAANGILFTTDFALIAALIITIRAITHIELTLVRGKIDETL
jgi:hypothetical protein